MNWKQRILDVFFPPRCPVCGDVVRSGEVFCSKCLPGLLCGRAPKFTHGQRLAFSRAFFVMDYDERTRPAVRRLKEIPDSAEAHRFAALLADELRAAEETNFSCVAFVPMAEKKRLARGHNQAETLAVLLAEELSLPLAENLLHREQNDTVQHTLSREARAQNAAASYSAVPGARVSGRVLLVDDVLTSGATLDRCAALLREMGACDVVAAAAVSTPAHKTDHEKTLKGE